MRPSQYAGVIRYVNMKLMLCIVISLALALTDGSPGKAPTIELNDGSMMPVLALGTGQATTEELDGADKFREAVFWAIEAGYRHIDTAATYGDEIQVGQAIADAIAKGLVTREELFITTKLCCDRHREVLLALRESLGELGLDYVDLYLIHFPAAVQSNLSASDDYDYLDTWKDMEIAKDLGLAKSIGVSNFNSTQLDRVIANSKVRPVVNAIEVNPTFTQISLVEHCQAQGVAVMAHTPFGFLVHRDVDYAPPPRADDPVLVAMAQKYGKSSNQIVLRYLIERGLTPIPKSVHKNRIAMNIDIFDFSLTPEEVAQINDFNKNVRVFNFTFWKDFPNYPFYEY